MKIEVNGLQVPEQVYDREIARLKQAHPQVEEKEIVEKVKDHLVRQALLRAATAQANIGVPAEEVELSYRNFIQGFGGEEAFLKSHGLTPEQIPLVKDDIALNLEVEKFLDSLTQYVVLPKEEKLREYYDRDTRFHKAPPMVRASHILKRPGPGVYDAICAIRERVMNGENFGKVATDCTESNEIEGDLGFFPRGVMVPEFEDIVFSMGVGEISPVFRSSLGYHIVKVMDKREAHQTTFEEVEEELKRVVLSKMRESVINAWIEKELKTAQVSISE